MRKPIKPIKLKISIDSALFKEIRALIMAARKAVVRNIDTIQVMTSFEIGRRIVECVTFIWPIVIVYRRNARCHLAN